MRNTADVTSGKPIAVDRNPDMNAVKSRFTTFMKERERCYFILLSLTTHGVKCNCYIVLSLFNFIVTLFIVIVYLYCYYCCYLLLFYCYLSLSSMDVVKGD
jgi:hypothetical protein